MRRAARALTVFLAVAASPGSAAGPHSWLEGSPLVNWNRPGARIPRAPAPAGDLPTAERCRGGVARPAENALEREVTRAGWTLFGGAEANGRTRMVSGCTSVDGMCRPLGYQLFVFVDGRFAGTLSPRPMDSRADGSVRLGRLLSSRAVSAEIARYAAADALCCPSRVSTVLYELRETAGGPLLVPTSVTTAPEATSPAGACGAPPTATSPRPPPAARGDSCGNGTSSR